MIYEKINIEKLKNIHLFDNSFNSSYKKELNSVKIFTQEEEVELYKSFIAGNLESADNLIKSQLKFIVLIAKQFYYTIYSNKEKMGAIEFSDIIAAGNEGLVKCLYNKKWDYTRGERFISYAYYYIYGFILKLIQYEASIIRIPINKRREIYSMVTKYKKKIKNNKATIDYDDLKHTKKGKKMAHVINLMKLSVVSLDDDLKKTNEIESDNEKGEILNPSLKEQIVDENGFDFLMFKKSIQNIIELIIYKGQKRERKVSDKIKSREQEIIKLYFGFEDEPWSKVDISKKFKITKQRVQQIIDVRLSQWKEEYKDCKLLKEYWYEMN